MNITFSYSTKVKGDQESIFKFAINDPAYLTKSIKAFGPVPSVKSADYINGVRVVTLSNNTIINERVVSSGTNFLNYEVDKFPFPFSLLSRSARGKYYFSGLGENQYFHWEAVHKLTSPVMFPFAFLLKKISIEPLMKFYLQQVSSDAKKLLGILFLSILSTHVIAQEYKVSKSPESVIVESKYEIDADCSRVWNTLVSANTWAEWNSSLYLRKPISGEVKKGTKLYLTALHTLWFNPIKKFPVNVEVTAIKKNKLLIWKGSPMGVFGYHGFKLYQKDLTCKVYQWEEGFGPLAKAGKSLGVFESMGRIHVEFLKALGDQVVQQLINE